MKLITLLVVIAGVIALAQLAKVGQLTALIRNKKEEDISEADSRLNGSLFVVFMVLFYASFVWLLVRYGDYAPPSASAHGEAVDTLMSFNMYIITAVFFLVNTALFLFANKYRYEKGRKAKFFAHDNRLELVWTVIPSIVLAVIIIYGLRTWNDMTGAPAEDALRVEVYSKQFDWTARYPGADGEFGLANYNLITPTNPLGIVTADGVEEALEEIEVQIAKIESELSHERGRMLAEIEEIQAVLHHNHHAGHGHAEDHGHGDHGMSEERTALLEARLHELEHMLESDDVVILSEAAFEAKEDKLHRLKRHRQRIMEVKPFDFDGGLSAWEAGMDDKIMKGEFHLPVGREVEFVFRSRDVIHSAYMPHFRAQMNTVPGVPTRFKMTPTITTDSMRTILNNPDFDYILLCNKVCGAAHFNMQMKVVVESEEEYNAWLESQEEFLAEKPNMVNPDARAEVTTNDNEESATL
ncbi:MAG: cytochrome c oxidase subunit II [Bacteroidetes bacterium]|nr:cytochrome c oxidase subunit II [Bacteroidota bacterium]MDA0903452.1 cytochrome c oxidase subunit II [Bacteroidota bacterium]MDA1241516.1 cytochrome c oxidase subunit II [Bacteroidota bacterium]